MGRVVILGVFVADTAYRAARQPRMGETILGKSFALGPGGKGSNQSVAAARLGADVHFVSRLGQDDFAEMALKTWQGAGVHPAITQDPDSFTGAAYIFIDDASGDNAIIISPGAAADISPADVESRADLIRGADVFVTQLEQPMDAAMRGLEIAREAGVATILNPAPAAELSPDMLALCDYVTPNETETEALTGISVVDGNSARAASDALRSMGVGTPIITMGAQGAYLHDGGGVMIPAVDAGAVIETTGAGDAFNGGLATGLSEGMPVRDAVRFGCAVAGISVTRPGTAPSMPLRAEVDQILEKNA